MSDIRAYFEERLPASLAKDPATAAAVGAIYVIKINGDDGGTWTVNLKDAVGVAAGDTGKGECSLEMSAESWQQLQAAPQSAMQLFFMGKLKVQGNAMLATKLQQFLGKV